MITPNTKINLIELAEEFAKKCHSDTNHLYDGKPYHEAHIQKVVNIGKIYLYKIPEIYHERVICGCWLHDVIEDTRQTYNDIQKLFGDDIAEIVYALTNEKGKTRKERANYKYYNGIKNIPLATYIKICDRIANVEHSIETKNKMFEMYKKEQTEFKEKLFDNTYLYLWEHLGSLFTWN